MEETNSCEKKTPELAGTRGIPMCQRARTRRGGRHKLLKSKKNIDQQANRTHSSSKTTIKYPHFLGAVTRLKVSWHCVAPASSAPPRAAAVAALLQPPGPVWMGHPSGHGGSAPSPPPNRRHGTAAAAATPGKGLLQCSTTAVGWVGHASGGGTQRPRRVTRCVMVSTQTCAQRRGNILP